MKVVTVSGEQLRQLIMECLDDHSTNEDKYKKDKEDNQEGKDVLLTRKQTRDYFKTSYTSLNTWANLGLISRIRMNSRVFFSKKEIQSIISNKLKK